MSSYSMFLVETGFLEALENMEMAEKIHAWKNHGI